MSIRFTGQIRQWDPAKPGGLAVIDVPADLVAELGGRRQMRVTGTLNGHPYTGSTMLVAGGGFCIGASKAVLKSADATIGDQVTVDIAAATAPMASRSVPDSAPSRRRSDV